MSWQMKAVGLLMRATRKRRFTDPEGGHALLTAPKGPSAPPRRTTSGLAVTERTVDGFPVYAVRRPTTPETCGVVVYAHGGAYVNEIAKQHWQLVAHVARELDVEVWVPIYGLAPQHTAARARGLMATLLEQAGGRSTYVAGDSAGGGLALLAAQQDARRPDSTLKGVTVLAPWVDLTMANPEIAEVEKVDPWLARAALHEVARVWAAGTALDDPSVSPLFGEMKGLPPTAIWVGTRDITLPDSRLLAARLTDAGVDVSYHEQDGAIHVFPILPVPEAGPARARILDHVRRHLGA